MSFIKHLLVVVFATVIIVSCKDDKTINPEVSNIDVNFKIERFETAFNNAKPEDLPKLKQEFPFMFSKRFKDEVWLKQLTDTLQKELRTETIKSFKDITPVKAEITSFFQHLKHYYPAFKTPRVVTTTSSVDYRNKVIVTDSLVIISLDTYLGKDHYFYQDIDAYLRANFEPDQITSDLAREYAKRFIFPKQNTNKTLLDEMVYYGKQLYFADVMLPNTNDSKKIGYTQAQIDWAKVNESEIWRYFIDKELLYSTDSKLPGRFINPGPFSKFYLQEIDAESPGRIGRYIGWQIVKAYAKNNKVSLQDVLETDAETIFKQSKFKPQR